MKKIPEVVIIEQQGEISGFVGSTLSRFIQNCVRNEPELADINSDDFKAWEQAYDKRMAEKAKKQSQSA